MATRSESQLSREGLEALRRSLEPAFSEDTASPGFSGTTPSTGHCAAVAAIVQALAGGELISAYVDGQSHWYNRVALADGFVDVDLTGDQFGLPPLQVAPEGSLYPGARRRDPTELASETLQRALLLARRARIVVAAAEMERLLRRTHT